MRKHLKVTTQDNRWREVPAIGCHHSGRGSRGGFFSSGPPSSRPIFQPQPRGPDKNEWAALIGLFAALLVLVAAILGILQQLGVFN